MKDPRYKNTVFSKSSPKQYFLSYLESLHQALLQIDEKVLDKLFLILSETAKKGHQVFVAGNGGSASIANHLCCDWTKGTHTPHLPPLKTESLVSNEALVTAIANDFGYQYIFSKQLQYLASPNDVVVLISASGNSQNVVEAARQARQLKLTSVGFTGFSGGELAKLVDLNVHIDFPNYGIVEDSHQIIMHTIGQYIASIWDQRP